MRLRAGWSLLWPSCCLVVALFGDRSVGDENKEFDDITIREHWLATKCPPPIDPSLLDLPLSHVSNMARQYPNYIRHYCNDCKRCIVQAYDYFAHRIRLHDLGTCWGYETDPPCPPSQRFYPSPICNKSDTHIGSVATVRKMERFYDQGDFGYVYDQRQQLRTICDPGRRYTGILQCTDNAQFCRGRNIQINFERLLDRTELIRYHTDVLDVGDIGECSERKGGGVEHFRA